MATEDNFGTLKDKKQLGDVEDDVETGADDADQGTDLTGESQEQLDAPEHNGKDREG